MRVQTAFMLMIGAALGCYRDTAAPASAGTATVRLMAIGLPATAVQRIEVYVSEIAASTESPGDSAPVGWAVIARPDDVFNVPMVADRSVPLGNGLVPVGRYEVVRLTLDGAASNIWLADGRLARVRWPSQGAFPVYAAAEEPVEMWPEVDILLELDVAQSFSTLLADPLHDLVFTPVVRVAGPTRAFPLIDTALEAP